MKRLTEDSTTARVFLAFLGSAGLFYVNIMPALVNGLITGLNFSAQQAGYIASANVYGAALGAITAIILVRRLAWRRACAWLLCALLGVDLICCFVNDFATLISLRAVHGWIGGLSVGLALAIMARTPQADRSFGYLLLIQFGFGGICVMLLPPLVPHYGVNLLFFCLMAFSFITLLMLRFLPSYSSSVSAPLTWAKFNLLWSKALPIWLSLFLFQAANMALNAYIISIGQHHGLSLTFVSEVVGIANWVSLLGALFVIVLAHRFNRHVLLTIGLSIGVLGNAAFLRSDVVSIFILANMITATVWSFCVPYFFGYIALLDPSGQLATVSGLASKLGLATGPLVAALMLGSHGFDYLIVVASAALLLGLIVMLPVYQRMPAPALA